MNKTAALLLLCTTLFAQQKGTLTDTRDGKTYNTVKIGEQVWMAENLNYEAEGSRCYGEGGKVFNPETENYDIILSNVEIQANCKKYGKLYDLETAMKACPGGWHLSSNEEWNILTEVVGGNKTAGKYLKGTSGWNWNDEEGKSGNGNDKFGFSALPGGFGYSGGNFYGVGYDGEWWESSRSGGNSYNAYGEYMDHIYENVYPVYGSKDNFLSVRCVQD
jgi:uncharacterized protein (TIGR02145 family)